MKIKNLFIFIIIFFSLNLTSSKGIDSGSYLAGKYAQSQKNYSVAINFFEKAIDLNKLEEKINLDLAKELCNLYLLEGKIEKCVVLGKQVESYLTSESSMILLALIIDDIKKNNLDSALDRLERVKQDSYERFSVPIIKSWLIATKSKNYKKSLETINQLEKDMHINGIRFLHLALINEYFDQNEEALIFYEKSINSFLDPSFRLVQLAGNAFERSKQKEKARKIYLKFSNAALDDLLIQKELKRVETSNIPNKVIKNLPDAISELLTNLASTFRSDFTNNYSIIYTYLSLYLKNDSSVSQMYLAELLENEGKYKKANDLYKKISKGSRFDWHARLREARNLEIIGEHKKSVDQLERMSKEKPNRYDSLQLLGDIYRNYDKYVKAINVYNQAFDRIDTLEKSHWELLYSRGMAYERSGKWVLAEKDFLQVVNFVPNEADVLNYLGYSWIEKGINIEEAKKLIIKAAKIRPRDPYIIDSLGWVYYKLEEYDKAIVELEKALSLKPTDPVINDHLGDAYNKGKRKVEAVYQWKKALYFKPNEELKKSIEEKLKDL